MFEIHLCGGIGSQFLRFLAGIGYAIKKSIKPNRISIVHHPYNSAFGLSSWTS